MDHEVKYYSKIILQGWAQNSVSSELRGSFCSPLMQLSVHLDFKLMHF